MSLSLEPTTCTSSFKILQKDGELQIHVMAIHAFTLFRYPTTICIWFLGHNIIYQTGPLNAMFVWKLLYIKRSISKYAYLNLFYIYKNLRCTTQKILLNNENRQYMVNLSMQWDRGLVVGTLGEEWIGNRLDHFNVSSTGSFRLKTQNQYICTLRV